MNKKTIIGILLVIAILFIATNLIENLTVDDELSMFVNRGDSEQTEDECRELIFDADESSWIESTNSFDITINECDKRFQECYAKTGNVYTEFIECYSNSP